jgi:hypothetical protein
MLILKGILLAIAVFAIVAVILFYALTPRNASLGSMMFPVGYFQKAGIFTTGVGIGMLLVGAGLLWLGKFSTAHLLSHIQK